MRIESICSALVLAVSLATLYPATEAGAKSETWGSIWVGPGYTLLHDKGTTDAARHLGGIHMLATLGMKGKYAGFRADIFDIDAMFSKNHTWVHLGVNLGLTLDVSIVSFFTGAGLWINGLKDKDDRTAYSVPYSLGFRWPVELGFRIWKFRLYGGLEFDFAFKKGRVSDNRFNKYLGDENSFYVGFQVIVPEKKLGLDIRWTHSFLHDKAAPEEFSIMIDLMKLLGKGRSTTTDTSGGSDTGTTYSGDETPSYEPSDTSTSSSLAEVLGGVLSVLDAYDDTMMPERVDVVYMLGGLEDPTKVQSLDGLPVSFWPPELGVLLEISDGVGEPCEDYQQLNRMKGQIEICLTVDDAEDWQRSSFWDAVHSVASSRYGAPADHDPSFDAGSYFRGLFDARLTGKHEEVFSWPSQSSPGVTLYIDLIEWDGDVASWKECLTYVPKAGHCPAPVSTQMGYWDLSIHVPDDWYSPGCQSETSCSVDHQHLIVMGDFLEPLKCTGEGGAASVLHSDSEYFGLTGRAYVTETWTYLNQPATVRIYSPSDGFQTILTTQQIGESCYTGMFKYMEDCSSCELEIKSVIESVTSPMAPAPPGTGASDLASAGHVFLKDLKIPTSGYKLSFCNEAEGCLLYDENTLNHVSFMPPFSCGTREEIESMYGIIGTGYEGHTKTTETWTFLGQEVVASVFTDTTEAELPLTTITFIHVHAASCYVVTVMPLPNCPECIQKGKELVESVTLK